MLQMTSSGRSLMYRRKRAGIRMKPWVTQAPIGYSCEKFPSRTKGSSLLIRLKKRSRKVDQKLRLELRRGVLLCPTLSKAFDIWKATACVA